MIRRTLLLMTLLVVAVGAQAQDSDPVPTSVMWDYFHKSLLGGESYRFDPQVRVEVPPFAEDARQVPLTVDASVYQGRVKRILAWAELNPIPQIFDFEPGPDVVPRLSIRIRVEQATPIRAAVLTDDGVWHVGSAQIEAAGGGCTAPSVVRAEPGWESRLGQVLGKRFELAEGNRLRLRVYHPMDNGLISGIPEFFIETAQLRRPNGEVLAQLRLYPAISENPTLSLDVAQQGDSELWLRDNNGNEFKAAF